MRNRPRPLWAALIRSTLVLAMAVVGALVPGISGPAAAAPILTSQTSIFALPTTPVVSRRFEIVGQVSFDLIKGPAYEILKGLGLEGTQANMPVTLERRRPSDGQWIAVATTKTTKRTLFDGKKYVTYVMYTFVRQAHRSETFRVRFDLGQQGSGPIESSVSKAVRVRVQRKMPVRLTQPRPSRLYLAGSVKPLYAKQRVVVLRKTCLKCNWKRFARPRTDARGCYRVRLSTPRKKGSHYFIVRAKASRGFAASYSKQARIRRG